MLDLSGLGVWGVTATPVYEYSDSSNSVFPTDDWQQPSKLNKKMENFEKLEKVGETEEVGEIEKEDISAETIFRGKNDGNDGNNRKINLNNNFMDYNSQDLNMEFLNVKRMLSLQGKEKGEKSVEKSLRILYLKENEK